MKIRFSKNQKIVAALGALIIISNAIFAIVFVFRVKWAQTEIFGSHFTVSYGKTVALNEAARRPRLSGAKYAFFAFTDEQRAALIESYATLPAASLTLRLSVENAAEAAHYRSLMAETRSFYYGFIYAEDFDAKGALKDEAKHSVSAAADLRDFLRNADGETRFDISLALDKDLKAAELPRGFFVYSRGSSSLIRPLHRRSSCRFRFYRSRTVLRTCRKRRKLHSHACCHRFFRLLIRVSGKNHRILRHAAHRIGVPPI